MVIFCLLLVSCSAGFHLRRAMIKESPQWVLDEVTTKYPEFIKQMVKEVVDTTYVHYAGFDTIRVMRGIDTLVINNNNQIIKVFRNYDTIRVLGEARVDTIIRYIEVPMYHVDEVKKRDNGTINLIVILLIIMMLCITIIYLLSKKRN